MRQIGIMQGRLTPPLDEKIQFFPFDNWEKEFVLAEKLKLNEIEFIFDFEKYQQNPLWNNSGIAKINQLIKYYNIKVNHICADFFMIKPIFNGSVQEQQNSIEILKKLITKASLIGAQGIEIPLVDQSRLKTKTDAALLIKALRQIIPIADDYNINIVLETDLSPQKFVHLLRQINRPRIKANYDSGNSSALGYNSYEEVIALKDYISNIHIKDRLLHGKTVPLGTGDANFEQLFKALKHINYQGSFILQAARGIKGKEAQTIRKQIKFLKKYLR